MAARVEAMYHLPSLLPSSAQPEDVSGYHSLVPLEPVGGNERRKSFGGYHSTVYRGIKSEDGLIWCLRRVENFRPPSEHAFYQLPKWKSLSSPHIISPVECFTTRAWHDSSLVLVYPYYPLAEPIVKHHQSQRIDEKLIWSYVIQLASGIKAVHDRGMAVRVLDPVGSKVLVTSDGRVRIGSVGIWDIITFDPVRHAHGVYAPGNNLQELSFMQSDDLLNLGKVIVSICTTSSHQSLGSSYVQNSNKAMEMMSRSYSLELKNLTLWLLSKPSPHKNTSQLMEMLTPKLLGEMDSMQTRADTMESYLYSQLENGRAFRLMTKLGFINERPEFDMEPRWSEMGDRYVVKLFRDFVFHQVDEEGNPLLDLGHVMSCLNKLDAGSEERLMLVSRDEHSCLIVSYKDVKACIEGAYRELARHR